MGNNTAFTFNMAQSLGNPYHSLGSFIMTNIIKDHHTKPTPQKGNIWLYSYETIRWKPGHETTHCLPTCAF